MISPTILDNSPGKEVILAIKDQLRISQSSKFAIGYFFLSGFTLIDDDFPDKFDDNLPFLKIIMGNETTSQTKEELVDGYKLRENIRQKMVNDLIIQDLNEIQISNLKNLKDYIGKNIIHIKLFEKSKLHAKLYLFTHNSIGDFSSNGLAIVGSSNFTQMGLTQNKELNVILTSQSEVEYLNQWFENLWADATDFREDLLKVIDISGKLPESTYPKLGEMIEAEKLFRYLVYSWFGNRVLNLPEKDILMEFQVLGVLNAVNALNSYNGVILADSVGLGKSFIASAIIEEFINGKHPQWNPKDKQPGILLILPPSIIVQWEELLIGRMDKNNIDQLFAGKKIKSFSDYFFKENTKRMTFSKNNYRSYEIFDVQNNSLGTIAFLSLGIFQNMHDDDLDDLKNDYELFIIDEAHKYRNMATNRWNKLRKLQKKQNNFPNKFLLLTATPLNNSIKDIYNIIRLFTDDTFSLFGIRGINVQEMMIRYSDLKNKYYQTKDSSIKLELMKVAYSIKKEVLDEIMVLRTRKYISEQFTDIKIDGKQLTFKDPQPFDIDYSGFESKRYKAFMDTIVKNLEYLTFEYTALYGTKYVVFEEENIQSGDYDRNRIELADLFKLLLGKRLESSIYSFETTLKRFFFKEEIFYNTLKKCTTVNSEKLLKSILNAVQKSDLNKELEEISLDYDIETDYLNDKSSDKWFDNVLRFLMGYGEDLTNSNRLYTKNEVLRLGLNKALENMEHDLSLMEEIIEQLNNLKIMQNNKIKVVGSKTKESKQGYSEIYSYDDPKFEVLKQLLANPNYKSDSLDIPSLNNKKIIIFTQYSDTAYYIYNNIMEWANNDFELKYWLKDNKDRLKISLVTGDSETSSKINNIKRFSPKANNGFKEVNKFGEIEILISTDALSEGVNLQDAEVVINYDLPWNPMVIVQRVGRVNRIGSDTDVYVANFTPSTEIEVIVGLLSKLKEKIDDITLVVGKETRILYPDEEINVETFGEKIKDLSKLSIDELERYGISDDFEKFIPQGIPKEQLEEYRLLNIIQFDLGYKPEDFSDIISMNNGPYYTFIDGKEKFFSVYKFYRNQLKIMQKILSTDSKLITEESPMVFLDLIKKKMKGSKVFEAADCLKQLDTKTNQLIEEMKKDYQIDQIGFLDDLRNALILEIRDAKGFEDKIRNIINIIPHLNYRLYSRDIKKLLLEDNLIYFEKNLPKITDLQKLVQTLNDYFNRKGFNEIISLKLEVKNSGWFYEI